MSRWFRHYAGMCRDDKLVGAAIRAKQPVERVVWVWCAILESAAEIDNAGQYNLDAAEAAYFLRADEADICAIELALATSGRLDNGCVVAWGKRQFSSDRSKERVAAYRERKRAATSDFDNTNPSQNSDVTLQKRHGNAPEAETETDTDKNAASLGASASEREMIEAKCREAGKCEQAISPLLFDLSPILRCLKAGASFELDVLPTIRTITARNHRWQSWRYAESAIMDAKASREAPAIEGMARGQPPPSQLRGSAAIVDALKRMETRHEPQPSPASPFVQLPAS